MNYLYTLTKLFWQEFILDNIKNTKVDYLLLNRKISDYTNTISQKDNFYYDDIQKNLLKNEVDIDLFCDTLLYIPWEDNKFCSFLTGDYLSFNRIRSMNNYYVNEMNLKFFFIMETLTYFKRFIRENYLPNFMEYEENNLLVKKFINIIQEMKNLALVPEFNQKINTYEELVDYYNNIELKRADIASQFIDDNNTQELIIKQQKFYIQELDHLLDEIDKVGNITKLADLQFQVLLKCIFYFKQLAYQKIELFQKTNEKYLVKKI